MEERTHIYFLGVGGIGMSALARYFSSIGKIVGGYDKTETVLTKTLSEEGIWIHYEDNIVGVPEEFKDPKKCLIVLTPAIPKDHEEWAYFEENGFEILKRAQVLGLITKTNYNVAVSGTHGKTTISSMISHVLKYCNYPLTAFLGGISKDLGSNYYHDDDSKVTVIEADEFDRSFLQLTPDIVTVSAVDPDHLDIYGTKEEMEKTFRQLLNDNLRSDGKSIIQKSLEPILGDHHLTYALEDSTADFYTENFTVNGVHFIADFCWGEKRIEGVESGIPGIHNLENSLLAFAVGLQLGINPEMLKEAIKAYTGVERRFDIQIQSDKIVMIDDYAHHPEEITKFVSSVRKMYPDKRILGVFQPHLFSRTQDFMDGFARSLELLDDLLLLEIYPAREQPIPGVTSSALLDRINMNSKTLCSKKDLVPTIFDKKSDVVLIIGAGDIGAEVPNVKKSLLKKFDLAG